jgi:SAM-dependent methyltransferase
MEIVKCDLCGSDRHHPYLNTTDRFSDTMHTLSICNDCGLVFLSPRPSESELAQYYPDEYEAYLLPEEKRSSTEQWHARKALTMQLNYVERYSHRRGRLLDIGCATGNYMHLARQRGWDVLGIEIIEKAARVARDTYHLPVISSTVETVELPPGSLDVVTLWDVVEHLPSPRVAFQRLHEFLKPGGMVFFSIPNLNSFDRYLFGQEWIGWDAPRHFHLFDIRTITRMLSDNGFKVMNRRCLLGGKGTFFLSMDRILRKNPRWRWLQKFYPLLGWLLWPYRQFAYLLLRGPIIYYAVQKVDK